MKRIAGMQRNQEKEEALRDVNERKNAAGGWEIGWRGDRKREGLEGKRSRRKEERSILRLSLSVRATRLAVATRRSINVPRRRSSRSLPLPFTGPATLPLPVSLLAAPTASPLHIREGGIIEIARRRGAPDGEGNVGSAGVPRTSGYRSATPLCPHLLPSREPSFRQDLSFITIFVLLARRYQKYGKG